MSNLIPLQNATITQFPQSDDKSWFVRSEEGDELGTLPQHLSDRDAMSYLHFARPFELEALNIGINFGKQEALKVYENREIALRSQIEFLEQQNERLSKKLEELIIGAEEENN